MWKIGFLPPLQSLSRKQLQVKCCQSNFKIKFILCLKLYLKFITKFSCYLALSFCWNLISRFVANKVKWLLCSFPPLLSRFVETSCSFSIKHASYPKLLYQGLMSQSHRFHREKELHWFDVVSYRRKNSFFLTCLPFTETWWFSKKICIISCVKRLTLNFERFFSLRKSSGNFCRYSEPWTILFNFRKRDKTVRSLQKKGEESWVLSGRKFLWENYK